MFLSVDGAASPRPWHAAAVVAALVSQNLGAALAKGLFPLVGTEGVTALRVGLSALLLLAVFRPGPWPRAWAARGNLLAYGVMLGLMNLLIYRAFDRIPLGVAIAIEVTGPLAVVLAGSRRALDFVWWATAVAGLALLLPVGAAAGTLDPLGVACAAGAAVCWALYITFGRRVAALPQGQAVSWGMAVAAAAVVPVGWAQSGAQLVQPAALALGLAVAVLSSALPYTLEMVALRHLSGRVFGMLVSAAPAIGAAAGWLLLDEHLSARQWGAVAAVIAASAGAALTARPSGR